MRARRLRLRSTLPLDASCRPAGPQVGAELQLKQLREGLVAVHRKLDRGLADLS